jgi:glyoxylase-like metal-dependent hydrolase (beta-lactamase superfamily II)
MLRITAGLVQITRAANIFLLQTASDELTVVDSGVPGAVPLILSSAQSLGFAPSAIRHILVTHADMDHAGSLAALVAATGATVYAGAETARYLATAEAPPHNRGLISMLIGRLQKVIQKPVQVSRIVHDGETLPIGGGISAYAAPGHTPDNYCFLWRKESVLFAADLFNTANGSLSLTPSAITWDNQRARESAASMLALHPRIICVGHGNSINLVQSPRQADSLLRALNTGSKLVAAGS